MGKALDFIVTMSAQKLQRDRFDEEKRQYAEQQQQLIEKMNRQQMAAQDIQGYIKAYRDKNPQMPVNEVLKNTMPDLLSRATTPEYMDALEGTDKLYGLADTQRTSVKQPAWESLPENTPKYQAALQEYADINRQAIDRVNKSGGQVPYGQALQEATAEAQLKISSNHPEAYANVKLFNTMLDKNYPQIIPTAPSFANTGDKTITGATNVFTGERDIKEYTNKISPNYSIIASYNKTYGTGAAKNILEDIGRADAISQNIQKANTALGLLNEYVETGGTEAFQAKASNYGADFGLNFQALGPTQFFNGLTRTLALSMMGTGTSRLMPGSMSDADREFFVDSFAGIGQSVEGNKLLLNYMMDEQALAYDYIKFRKDLLDAGISPEEVDSRSLKYLEARNFTLKKKVTEIRAFAEKNGIKVPNQDNKEKPQANTKSNAAQPATSKKPSIDDLRRKAGRP